MSTPESATHPDARRLNRPAKAVFLDAASLGDDLDLDELAGACDRLTCHAFTEPEQVLERVADHDIAICNKSRIDAKVLARAAHLKLVLVTATGVNNVDVQAASRLGVEVRNCRDYGTAAVAQHTLMLMLALHTRVFDYQSAMRDGAWQRAANFCLLDYPILELAGRRLGIVGRGPIGQAVASLARAFGMQVVFAQLPGRPAAADTVSWDRLLPSVDVLSLHCPLNEPTRHLINAQVLATMRKGAMLINTARAGLIDAPALIAALRSGHLGGAAMDGLDVEPPREGHVLLDPTLPRFILTPHTAWASQQARQRLVKQTVENLQTWRHGEALHIVTPDPRTYYETTHGEQR